ncbi:ClpX C4-type zinc finger protein [Myxococcaceae bacterium GXIMD 01537]
MKTPQEVAREESARARSNAERARAFSERATRVMEPGSALPSGSVAMAAGAAHSASLAATAASDAAAHALALMEQDASPTVLEQARLAVATATRAAVEAAQAAMAASGVVSILMGTPGPHPAGARVQETDARRCTFCGRSDADSRLVAGPSVFICEECVKLCASVLGLDVR